MLIGYARVSTQDQNQQLQLDTLKQAGCEKIFQEKASGPPGDNGTGPSFRRPSITCAQGIPGSSGGWTGSPGRSSNSSGRSRTSITGGIGFRSLTENIDSTTAGGRLVFHIFGKPDPYGRALCLVPALLR